VTAGVESDKVGELPPVSVEPETEIVNDGCGKLPGWFVEEPALTVMLVFAPAALAVRFKLAPEMDAATGEPAELRALARPVTTEFVVSVSP